MGTGLTVVRDPKSLPRFSGPVSATIGNFDGVHLGHQEVLRQLVQAVAAPSPRGTAGTSVVVSFYPHPSVVLGRASAVSQLTPLRQKVKLLDDLGVSILFLVQFTPALSRISAAEFLQRYFLEYLTVTHAVLGYDTAVGKNREGDREFIEKFLNAVDVTTEVVPVKDQDATRISSGRIRDLIAVGDVQHAGLLLGRPYQLCGRVRHGDARGRTIGIPTANILPNHQVLPRLGVYATRVRIVGGDEYVAVTNVGVRPTFGGGQPTIESHLLAFDGDLYGKRIEVQLLHFLRAEQKFPSVKEFKDQINRDIQRAKELLSQ